jgi:hypothetical protein
MDSFIDQLAPPVFWGIIGFLLAATAIMVIAGWHARRQSTLITATPTSNIGMATPGYCEFEGHAEAADGLLLASPLTNSPCVWFHAKVEKWVPSRRSGQSAHWSTVREETSLSPFLIRDSTGVAVVHPWGAEVTASDKSVWYGGREEPDDRSPARTAPAEWSSPVVEISGGPNSRYRFTEERIYAAAPLLVLGEFTNARFESGFGRDTDDEEDEAATVDANARDREESDEPSDGRRAWEDEALSARIDAAADKLTQAHIAKGTGTHPFILSTTLQAVHVAQSEMGSQAAFSIAPAPLLVAAFLLWVRFS